ncbi:MAG: phosphopantothenoylcysteine decarboxylase [Spirochaetes bacterium]|nr:phosphopantothenoylcysteine decarboxylase [Spirochaetota bacterium]MBN2769796.1 phosphopantothenoylcysteine decarboxylase [Spirochaetota bacterium]
MKIILGVTSSIAAYKACDITRLFVKEGHDVFVVMSKNALNLVSPLTFRTLSGNPVYHETFLPDVYNMGHIALKENANIFVCAPATANFIGKAASGIADDLITTTFLSMKTPIVIAPAMNPDMWSNPAVQHNISVLKKRNITIIEPDTGDVVCGDTGYGKLAPVDAIVKRSLELLENQNG